MKLYLAPSFLLYTDTWMGLFVDFDTLQGSVGCQLNTIFAVNRTRQGHLPTDHFVCLPQKFLPHTVNQSLSQ